MIKLKTIKNFFSKEQTSKRLKIYPKKENIILNANELFYKNPYIYQGISLIANSISNIDYVLMKNNELIEYDEVLSTLFNSPNSQLSWPTLLESIVINYLLYGNCYLLLERNSDGILKLHILQTELITVIPGDTDLPEGFKYNINSKSILFDNKNPPFVFHFKNYNPYNHWVGKSPLESIKISATLQEDINLHNLSIIQNGGRVSGIVSIDKDTQIPDEEKQNIADNLINQYQGPGNSGKIALIQGGIKWHETGVKSKDMDFNNAYKRSIKSITTSLGIPPLLLGESMEGDSSHINIEHIIDNFNKNTILPLSRKIFSFLNLIVKKIDPTITIQFNKK